MPTVSVLYFGRQRAVGCIVIGNAILKDAEKLRGRRYFSSFFQ